MNSARSDIPIPDVLSEFSRTVNGIKRMFTSNDFHESRPYMSKILSGEFCLKTCGMEDVQYAAQKAGEMMVVMRICTIILTVFVVISMTLLTVALFFCLIKKGSAASRRYHHVESPAPKSPSPGMSTISSAVSSLSHSLVD